MPERAGVMPWPELQLAAQRNLQAASHPQLRVWAMPWPEVLHPAHP